MVDFTPQLPWNPIFQCLFCLYRRLGINPTKSVADSMNMGIYTYQSTLKSISKIVQENVPMPVITPQADFMQICAIFGPTPGNFIKSCTVFGMSLLYLCFKIVATSLIFLAFVYKCILYYFVKFERLVVIYFPKSNRIDKFTNLPFRCIYNVSDCAPMLV